MRRRLREAALWAIWPIFASKCRFCVNQKCREISKSGTQAAVTVGTTIADRPPYRSVRARLRIRLLPWMSGGEARSRIGVQPLSCAAFRTSPNPCDTRSPLCVGLVSDSATFSTVHALPSPISAEDCSSLFDRFTGVGSEVARLRAGHRPPLKLYRRFSRIQLSRRLTLPRCNRRN